MLLKRLRNNTFLWHNSIFFLGSGIAGALNYAFYPILGRLLNLNQFGELQALFAIFTNVGILYAALGLVLVHIVGNNERKEAVRLLEELEKLGTIVLIVFAVAWIIAVPFIGSFLKFSEYSAVYVFYLTLVIGFFISTRQAVIQGHEDYWDLTINSVLGSFARLVFAMLLALMGGGVLGAILGLLLGQLTMFIHALWSGKRHSFIARLNLRAAIDWRRLRPELRYVIPVLIVSLATTILFSSDVLVVKHFFSPEVAGQYSGMAAAGRIIIFLTNPFAMVLFTKVKPTALVHESRKVLLKSLALAGVIGGFVAVVMSLIPEDIVRVLLGGRYVSQASNLPWLALALLLLSCFSLVAYYDLALRRQSIAWISIFGVMVGMILVIMSHATVRAVIFDIMYASLAMIVVRLGLTGYRIGYEKR